jgi:hypothetical protein
MGGSPPKTLRAFTIVYREDIEPAPNHECASCMPPIRHAALLKKDCPGPVVDALLDPPAGQWFVVVCDGGKIHVLPFARVNTSRSSWTVRFERLDVRCTPSTFALIIHHQAVLYRTGFVKEDIRSGEPHPGKLVKYGADLWSAADEVLSRHRNTPAFELALFLLKKESLDELIERTIGSADPRVTAALAARADGPGGPPGAGSDEIGIDRADQSDGLVASREVCSAVGDSDAGLRDLCVQDGREAPDRDPAAALRQRDLFDWCRA